MSSETGSEAQTSNLASNPTDPNQSTSISPVRNLATMSTVEDIMAHLASMDVGRTLPPPRPALPERRGGYLGVRWTPGCGEYKKESVDWLDFIWWNIGQSDGPYKLYNFQVCVRDESPAVPFRYTDEGVSVQHLNPLTGRPMGAHVFDNPETYIASPGDIFSIDYPTERGVLLGEMSHVHIQLPPLQMPGQRFIELRAGAPDCMYSVTLP